MKIQHLVQSLMLDHRQKDGICLHISVLSSLGVYFLHLVLFFLCAFLGAVFVWSVLFMCICCTLCVYAVLGVFVVPLCVFVVRYVYLLYLMCICCTERVLLFLL